MTPLEEKGEAIARRSYIEVRLLETILEYADLHGSIACFDWVATMPVAFAKMLLRIHDLDEEYLNEVIWRVRRRRQISDKQKWKAQVKRTLFKE